MAAISLDRLAKRSRDCLLCWFCENWIVIEPLLVVAECSSQPRIGENDPRNSCACTPEEPLVFEREEDFDFGFAAFESHFGSEERFEFFGVLE
jgi:hypothetical protein